MNPQNDRLIASIKVINKNVKKWGKVEQSG
jgi:hypothetical protein